jgi:hypothetical protein
LSNNRFGCFSSTGIIVAIVTVLVIGGVSGARGGVLFNPGELNAQTGTQPLGGVNSHAETGGDCGACHAAIWEQDTMSDRCQVCHSQLLFAERDFHSIMIAQSRRTTCNRCHTDHRGSEATLTILDMERFPHFDTASFALSAHAYHTDGSPFICEDCHGIEIAIFDQATCTECHQTLDGVYTERHLILFGDDCLACHDGRESLGADFDHNMAVFVLSGKHADLPCEQCHLNARTLSDLKSTAQNCFACHAEDDDHKNQLGEDCAACHNPSDWAQVDFDHDQSAFPLLGEHATVACQSCHPDGQYKDIPKECFACHGNNDPHNKQLGSDCAACHTPFDWNKIAFDHTSTSFSLEGSHAQVKCTGCHTNDRFEGIPQDCFSCHGENDPHDAQLGTDCAKCHTAIDWLQITFDHTQTAFPLDGGHKSVDCEDCHIDGQLQGTPQDCYACHAEDDEHNGRYTQNCAYCHNTTDWKEATFDHSLSAFRLTGAHVNTTCTSCHTDGTFKDTPQQCVACHTDPSYHRGLFGLNCNTCHSTSAWTPAQYNLNHRFPINHGEGGGSSCSKCHPNGLNGYSCYGCHEHSRGEVENEHREEGIKNFNNCVRCHPDGREHESEGGDD